MLTKVSQGVDYIAEKIQKITNDEVDKDVLETILQERFYEKLAEVVSEKDMEVITDSAETDEFVENYMIQKVPKYSTMLEDVVADVLAEYLSEIKLEPEEQSA